jgi:dihydrofolate synthase/folylpolyglutamate synthase
MSLPFHDCAGAYGWLESQIDYERTLSRLRYDDSTFALAAFGERLRALGDPHAALRTIHVAGTRGKGSAALALEALLEASGLRTAVFTSPHLSEWRERIRVTGRPIEPEAFARLLAPIARLQGEGQRTKSEEQRAKTEERRAKGEERRAKSEERRAKGEGRRAKGERRSRRTDGVSDLQPPASSLQPSIPSRRSTADGLQPYFKTVFENLTALFFLAAREARVDWAIVETGLGGRLDATNVLAPGAVLWTRIGLEHTHLLGTTLAAIAGEKAAILKPGGWAVMGAQAPGGEARGVFEARARESGARLARAEELCPLQRLEAHPDGLRLRVRFEGGTLELDTGLFGDFQAENIQNALAVLACLRERGLVPRAPHHALAKTLNNMKLPGRLERVAARPDVFVDGGHDPTAARALARAMAAHFGCEPAGLVVGMLEDKDHAAFFEALAAWPGWRWVRCYRVDSPRAAAPEALARAAARLGCPVWAMSNLSNTLESLRTDADKATRVIVTGTLYSVARAREWGIQHGRAANQGQGAAQTQPRTDHRHPGA